MIFETLPRFVTFRLLLCLFLLAPASLANAAIVINEVAWMGDTDSANNEWIELHNTGSSVSVDGWELSDGQNLEIELTGSIAGGAYAVLERTDDGSAPGTALLIYTGALSNDGRTLTLKRADGSIEDQVAGGEDWEQIGGDNVTKETAQYTGSGWVTAAATPGAYNATESTHLEEDESESNNTNSGGGGNSMPSESSEPFVSLSIPDTELRLSIVAPTYVQVHQSVDLSVVASGIAEGHVKSLSYQWNFGDTKTDVGKDTSVAYAHPGTYVVMVEANYARHQARARHEIMVLPATISLATNSAGDILLHNDAKYEVELSGYTLRGVEDYRFPPLSFIAPGATLTLDHALVGTQKQQLVILYDQSDTEVAMIMPIGLEKSKSTQALTQDVAPASKSVSFAQAAAKPAGLISATATSRQLAEAEDSVSVSAADNVAAANAPFIPPDKLPYLGLMGVMLVGILALYAKGGQDQKG